MMKTEEIEPLSKKRKSHDIKIEEIEPLSKKPKTDKGWEMMKRIGWAVGEGLGAQNQGLREPISASIHSSRHGLGLKDEHLGIEEPKTVWELGMDKAHAAGDIIAKLNGPRKYFDDFHLASGKFIGDRKDSLDNEHTFCDSDLLIEMLKCKSVLGKFSSLLDGRERSNPYEKIGKGFFMNRAAMKMVNLDYVSDYLFSKVDNNETLYFADICAGPGGFTEYILWKRPMQSCGFGFTLRGQNDFKLKNILCGPVECFHPSYGKHDDGDITNEDNLRKFQSEVRQGTGGMGVQTVMADGGFDVSGSESIQELLSKQLYLCQFLCAINILRTGGNFVCKLFDTFTDYSVGLIQLVSTLFDKLSIVKPITSRPANSERYIIFQNFTSESNRVDEVRAYLYDINHDLNEYKNTNLDVLKIVEHNVLKRDIQFYQFIKDINNKILNQQIKALAKLRRFIEDKNLIDDRQMVIQQDAFKLWSYPDIKRELFTDEKLQSPVTNFVHINYNNRFDKLAAPTQKPVSFLLKKDFEKEKFIVRNHYAAFIGPNEFEKTLYVVAKDKRMVSWYPDIHGTPNRLTEQVKRWSLSIPSFTILLVNFGLEYGGQKGNIRFNSVIVVDSPLIYGESISDLSYEDRMHRVTNLCCLLDPKLKGTIRPIDYFPLSDIKNYESRYISMKKAKGIAPQKMITCRKNDHFYPPGKLIIINVIRNPWVVAISKTKGYTYYYNFLTKQSTVDKPDDLYASYLQSHIYELDWKNDKGDFDYGRMLQSMDHKQ